MIVGRMYVVHVNNTLNHFQPKNHLSERYYMSGDTTLSTSMFDNIVCKTENFMNFVAFVVLVSHPYTCLSRICLSEADITVRKKSNKKKKNKKKNTYLKWEHWVGLGLLKINSTASNNRPINHGRAFATEK